LKRDYDPLAPARGIVLGTLLGCLMWVLIFGGTAIVLSRILR
jgi:hypothetical protein